MSPELALTALLLAAVAVIVLHSAWRGRRSSTIFTQMDHLTDQLEELTLRVVGLELNLSGYRVWSAQLRGQVVELGGTPIPPPPWLVVTGPAAADGGTDNPLVAIYHRIGDHFSVEEIDNLARDIGLDAEELGGESKSARARHLVESAYRSHLLPDLLRVAQQRRATADWPSLASVKAYQSSIGKSKK
jgi:hypothetical protein